VPTGDRAVTVIAGGYNPDSQPVAVADGSASTQNIALTPSVTGGGTGTLKGTVRSASGVKLSGVTVQVLGGPSATTNKGGKYSIQNVAEGLQTVTASKSGSIDFEDTVTITAGSTATLDFRLN
jgi:iron complex outermembrane receptor protein